jgi:nicotinamidase-related amidase
LPACREIFGIPQIAVGEYQQGNFPDHVAAAIEHLDIDALSVWRDPRLAKYLSESGAGVVLLGGAFLEEEVLIAALEGARHGYDIRLLSDLSVARDEGDRSIALTRLAHHGILATTIRQALLEWAVSLGDQAVGRRVRDLLS